MQLTKRILKHLNSLIHLAKLLIQGKHRKAKILIKDEYRALIKVLYMFHPTTPHPGIDVMSEDWDYLIILDSCRFDMFRETNTIPGVLKKAKSHGSSTSEWLQANFKDYYADVIYISANPHISNQEISGFKGTDHFFRVENVWDYGWDDALATVPPKEVTKAALKAREEYPSKRMIIHYIQPHEPWIVKKELLAHKTVPSNDRKWPTGREIWDAVKAGELEIGKVKEASREDLKLVLNEVRKLIMNLNGKIVISSDHGQSFGERYIFSHPTGVYITPLIEIPWFSVGKTSKANNHNKKETNSSMQSEETPQSDNEKIKERLQDLGYLM